MKGGFSMRKNGSNGKRLDAHDKDIMELQNKARNAQEELDNHINMHIKEDLQIPKFPGSNKHLYTYDEIADKHNIPKSRVQKIAEEENLTRRKLKVIG